MKTITMEDGTKVQISEESYKAMRDSLHNGEQLIRDLEPGEYEICGKRIAIKPDGSRMRLDSVPYATEHLSWIHPGDEWECQEDFERYIGKEARLITSGEIVRIEPKTGTALLDELEAGTLVAINGVKCAVTIDRQGTIYISAMLMFNSYAALDRDADEWQSLDSLSEAINKPVADLVEDDIVQLYPKEGEA